MFNCVLLCGRSKFYKYKIISVDKIYCFTMIKWSVFSFFRNLMVIMTSVLKMFFSFYWLYKGKQLKQVKATLYTSYHSQVYPLLCTVYTCFYSYSKFWICGLHSKEEKLCWSFYFISFAKEPKTKTYNVIKLKKGQGRRNSWGQLLWVWIEKKGVWNVKNDKIQEKRLTTYSKRSDEIAIGHCWVLHSKGDWHNPGFFRKWFPS